MNKVSLKPSTEFIFKTTLWHVFRTEWQLWLPFTIASFFFASILVSGLGNGLIPDLSSPYIYSDDGLLTSWIVQRATEGWFFNNPRSGYPFGSNFLDYPMSDSGNIIILKLLASLSGGFHSAINLYFLLGFSSTFLVSFLVLRTFRLNAYFSIACAILYTFLPFHFQRLNHLFYTWYFVVPIYFYAAFYIFYLKPQGINTQKIVYLCLWSVILIFSASFGVYYAAFGSIILIVAGISGTIKNKNSINTSYAVAAVFMIMLGITLNLSPHFINRYINGKNSEVANRQPMESEVYGLKMMQLILPHETHRINKLARIKQQYNTTRPLVNENSSAALGLLGMLGFVMIGAILLTNLSGRKTESRLRLLTLLVTTLFLFGTIGGLGAVFSTFISPSIRGWCRISIFISFGALTVFFLVIQMIIERYYSKTKLKTTCICVGLMLIVLGLYDQTSRTCLPCNQQTKLTYQINKIFIEQIEQSLPKGSAIYQLPYMPFPEVPPLNRLSAYDLMAGFIHSKYLRWNYAGIKGREGDLFYRSLSHEPIKTQLNIIRRLGFSGIYIDRRGFADNANELIKNLSDLIGPPSIIRADKEVVFFKIEPQKHINFNKLTYQQILKQINYKNLNVTARPPTSSRA